MRERKDLRRVRDSNPRYSFPYTRFPSVLLQPLGQLSNPKNKKIILWEANVQAYMVKLKSI